MPPAAARRRSRRARERALVRGRVMSDAVYTLRRVGGGESYSGGGSSSGGGSGGGSGAGELLYYLLRFLIWLTIHHPAVGIPVDIVVAFILYKWWKAKQRSEERRVGKECRSRW